MLVNADLFAGCLLPTCLSRDDRPRAQSIAWSPLGMAPNAGYRLLVLNFIYIFHMPALLMSWFDCLCEKNMEKAF